MECKLKLENIYQMKLNWISTRSKCSGYKHWGKLKKKKKQKRSTIQSQI